MGPWYFLNAHKEELFADRHPVSLVSRAESASPATGSTAAHALEQAMLVNQAFGN
jgi:2-oxoglutarate dehydrogenase E1 component